MLNLCGYDEIGTLGVLLMAFGLGWTVHWLGDLVIERFRPRS